MTKAELLALAARVEAAQGADRLLDYEVATACGRVPDNAVQMKGYTLDPGQYTTHGGDATPVQAFTASLDSAASLVPEGWIVANIGQNDDKTWFAELRQGFRTSYTKVVFAPKDYKAATPALALTAAALRAMAEEATDV